jgi:beta-phosphoglucomutase
MRNEKLNSQSIKGFFFDLDGTLVDTERANFEAYRIAIKYKVGVNIKPQQFKETNGLSYKEFLPMIVPDIDSKMIEEISHHKRIAYGELMHLTRANTFLVDFLQNIAGYHQTALVTTAKRANAQAVLAAHDLQHLFDVVVYGDDVKKLKPHPAAYLRALNLCQLEPNEALAFEDSSAGLIAARQAGISTIHIRSFL